MLDVAKCAGVSKSTVSRVLNGKDIVREEIKNLVYKAIEETGYRPNLLAQQMSTQKTRMIGLVVTSEVFNGPFFSSLIYNAAKYCEKYDHRLIFADGKHSAEEEISAIDFLVGMKCAGIMTYTKYLNSPRLEKIVKSSPVPVIVLNQNLKNSIDSSIFIDHYSSCETMMDFLFSMGHKKIAYISGKKKSISNTARQKAYTDKMKIHYSEPLDNIIVHGTWSMQSGYSATLELLEKKVAFTAILAANDDMALGTIKALKDNGIKVPEDISVAGFDNSKIGDFFSPPLTTIDVPLEEMFKRAVETILHIPQESKYSKLSGTLVIRDSVCKIDVS
ncbi:LacI family DNA-binding transcriptional regulator [Yersinia enterocolitica]